MELLQKHITEIFILLFLIITFLLSGIEKNHFNYSPLKNYVPFLLAIVLVTELIATGFMILGIFYIIKSGYLKLALFGLELSAICLLFLLIGQRLAKDYVGAMSLTIYFILTVFGIYLLNN